MSVLVSLLLALAQPATASAQPGATPPRAVNIDVDVGLFEPEDFPEVIRLDRRMPHAEMIARVERMLEDGRCTINGANDRRFNIVVPFAILMEANGTPESVVVRESGCAALETLVGQIVLAQLERGDFVPSHSEGDRWYVSELAFTLGGQQTAALVAAEDPDRMICENARPELGSRLRMVRVCRTAAQWRQYERDREQFQRDLNNSQGCGVAGGANCVKTRRAKPE